MDELFNSKASSEKFCTCRLLEDEIRFIDEIWDGKFSEYVHSCIKRDTSGSKQLDKSQLFKDFSYNVLLMGFGVIFFILGSRSITALELALSYVIGIFLLSLGVAGGMLIALQSARRKTRTD